MRLWASLNKILEETAQTRKRIDSAIESMNKTEQKINDFKDEFKRVLDQLGENIANSFKPKATLEEIKEISEFSPEEMSGKEAGKQL